MVKPSKQQREALITYQQALADLSIAEGALLKIMGWSPRYVPVSFGAREIRWWRKGLGQGTYDQKGAVSLTEQEIEKADG